MALTQRALPEEGFGRQAARGDRGPDSLPLAMAGLWERWKDRSTGDTVQTFTIIMTVRNEQCGAISDRIWSSVSLHIGPAIRWADG